MSPTADYGIPQINIVHRGQFDMSRIVTEPAYAIAAGFKVWAEQGVKAWLHCARKLGYL